MDPDPSNHAVAIAEADSLLGSGDSPADLAHWEAQIDRNLLLHSGHPTLGVVADGTGIMEDTRSAFLRTATAVAAIARNRLYRHAFEEGTAGTGTAVSSSGGGGARGRSAAATAPSVPASASASASTTPGPGTSSNGGSGSKPPRVKAESKNNLESYANSRYGISRAQVYRVIDIAHVHASLSHTPSHPSLPPHLLAPHPIRARTAKKLIDTHASPYVRQLVWYCALRRYTHLSPVVPDLSTVGPDDINSSHIAHVWGVLASKPDVVRLAAALVTGDGYSVDLDVAALARAVFDAGAPRNGGGSRSAARSPSLGADDDADEVMPVPKSRSTAASAAAADGITVARGRNARSPVLLPPLLSAAASDRPRRACRSRAEMCDPVDDELASSDSGGTTTTATDLGLKSPLLPLSPTAASAATATAAGPPPRKRQRRGAPPALPTFPSTTTLSSLLDPMSPPAEYPLRSTPLMKMGDSGDADTAGSMRRASHAGLTPGMMARVRSTSPPALLPSSSSASGTANSGTATSSSARSPRDSALSPPPLPPAMSSQNVRFISSPYMDTNGDPGPVATQYTHRPSPYVGVGGFLAAAHGVDPTSCEPSPLLITSQNNMHAAVVAAAAAAGRRMSNAFPPAPPPPLPPSLLAPPTSPPMTATAAPALRLDQYPSAMLAALASADLESREMHAFLLATMDALQELASRGMVLQPKHCGRWLDDVHEWRFYVNQPAAAGTAAPPTPSSSTAATAEVVAAAQAAAAAAISAQICADELGMGGSTAFAATHAMTVTSDVHQHQQPLELPRPQPPVGLHPSPMGLALTMLPSPTFGGGPTPMASHAPHPPPPPSMFSPATSHAASAMLQLQAAAAAAAAAVGATHRVTAATSPATVDGRMAAAIEWGASTPPQPLSPRHPATRTDSTVDQMLAVPPPPPPGLAGPGGMRSPNLMQHHHYHQFQQQQQQQHHNLHSSPPRWSAHGPNGGGGGGGTDPMALGAALGLDHHHHQQQQQQHTLYFDHMQQQHHQHHMGLQQQQDGGQLFAPNETTATGGGGNLDMGPHSPHSMSLPLPAPPQHNVS